MREIFALRCRRHGRGGFPAPACCMRNIVEQFCCRDDLSTSDPYDIWKTGVGFAVKNLYNRHRWAALAPAVALAVFDGFVNNRLRLFYCRQEYPVVRALAALSLLNLHRTHPAPRYLEYIRKHLHWLAAHSCGGYKGIGWGINFNHAVSKDLCYDANTPFVTITPYCLEAFVVYERLTDDSSFRELVNGVFRFLEEDILVMEETDEYMATSYAPMRDRIVLNASSYAMYCYALLLAYLPLQEQSRIVGKIRKLYGFLKTTQRQGGAWLYSPEGKSFIDCFHSCIVLKNLIKTDRIVGLPGSEETILSGYEYIKRSFLNRTQFLFRRFSMANRPHLARFELYDNAEMLNIGILLHDRELVETLSASIERHFCRKAAIYSQIDILGIRRNKSMLRWAIMPYLYAISQRSEEVGGADDE